MDQGNGLLDRFLVYVPISLRALPEEQIVASTHLQQMGVQNVESIYNLILQLDQENPTEFYFSDDAFK